jgi:hypothetical protein
MEAVKGGAGYGAPRGSSPAVTSSKPATEGNGQAGWDPFEVWRTRVRDVQQARARDGSPSRKR